MPSSHEPVYNPRSNLSARTKCILTTGSMQGAKWSGRYGPFCVAHIHLLSSPSNKTTQINSCLRMRRGVKTCWFNTANGKRSFKTILNMICRIIITVFQLQACTTENLTVSLKAPGQDPATSFLSPHLLIFPAYSGVSTLSVSAKTRPPTPFILTVLGMRKNYFNSKL